MYSDQDDTGLSFVYGGILGHDRDKEGNLWPLLGWWGCTSEEFI